MDCIKTIVKFTAKEKCFYRFPQALLDYQLCIHFFRSSSITHLGGLADGTPTSDGLTPVGKVEVVAEVTQLSSPEVTEKEQPAQPSNLSQADASYLTETDTAAAPSDIAAVSELGLVNQGFIDDEGQGETTLVDGNEHIEEGQSLSHDGGDIEIPHRDDGDREETGRDEGLKIEEGKEVKVEGDGEEA